MINAADFDIGISFWIWIYCDVMWIYYEYDYRLSRTFIAYDTFLLYGENRENITKEILVRGLV